MRFAHACPRNHIDERLALPPCCLLQALYGFEILAGVETFKAGTVPECESKGQLGMTGHGLEFRHGK